MLPNICSKCERMRYSRIKQHNCKSVIDEKHTNDKIRSFLRFFHGHIIDSPMGVVLLGSNSNRVGSTGRDMCGCSGLISTSARIGASVDEMSLFTTIVAPTIILLWVLGSLGLLNTVTSNSRSLEIVGALNNLTLRGTESLSGCLRLSRTEHRSS
jgi:hypothetical protein